MKIAARFWEETFYPCSERSGKNRPFDNSISANPMKIKNLRELLSHGDLESRKVVLEVAEKTLKQLDAFHAVGNLLGVERTILRVGSREWDLDRKRRLWVIGAGKACNAMARAVEEILGDRIRGGLV